ncbi:MAG: hypothetical protein KKG60_02180 [Nanoarchaeota archaeon]|nr:hypothetical protein [Nanoarchaeota archaeon]
MKKPYLKKYGSILGFTVWIVDGNYIRNHINLEFNNFGQHHRFRFIPKKEFWIDKGHRGGEEKYYITHMLIEQKMMSGGKNNGKVLENYGRALKKADLAEKRERLKSIPHNLRKNLPKKEIIKLVHKNLLKEYSNDLKVWVVDGNLVRTLLNLNFTQGGNDKYYSFIPKNEVWIDDQIIPAERKFVILHELHERNLMCQGWQYYPGSEFDKKHNSKNKLPRYAHSSAIMIEKLCRKNPHLLDKKLREVVAKSNKIP